MIQKPNIDTRLTVKQKHASEHYLIHGDKSAAYRDSYSCGNMKPTTINRNAHQLFETPHVSAYVQALKDKSRTKTIIERREALEMLTRIARDKQSEVHDIIAAIDRIAKLEGWDKPLKVNHGGVIFNINTSGK